MMLGEVFQVCYACQDRDSGVERLTSGLGLTGWVAFEAEIAVAEEFGGGSATVAVAFARWGRIVVEVLQPLHGRIELFADTVPADGGLAVHHLGCGVTDLPAARMQAQALGAPTVLAGALPGQLSYAFVDARSVFGYYLELVSFRPQGWSLMAGILGDPDAAMPGAAQPETLTP